MRYLSFMAIIETLNLNCLVQFSNCSLVRLKILLEKIKQALCQQAEETHDHLHLVLFPLQGGERFRVCASPLQALIIGITI